MSITRKALEHGVKLLGMPYSKTYRYKFYPGGSGDCSSFAYACYSAAGFPLLENGTERITSCYEVYADGFELKFPAKESDIGKPGKWAPKGFYKTFKWQPGDLIFYNFNKASTRANKITHVAMCYDKNTILHTANKRENVCKKPMSYGDGNILAVLRLKEGAKAPARPEISAGNKPKVFVRMMQILLNVGGENPRLNCDGVWGSKTKAALNAFKAAHGLPESGICDAETWDKLRGGWKVSRVLELTDPLMRGEDVAMLKEALIERGFLSKSTNDVFGEGTEKAVRAFQKSIGLEPTGRAGKRTIPALGGVWEG